MRSISFSVTDNEYEVIDLESRCKGLKVSGYCKMAVFSHLAKYPAKSSMAELVRLLDKAEKAAPDPTNLGSRGNSRKDQ